MSPLCQQHHHFCAFPATYLCMCTYMYNWDACRFTGCCCCCLDLPHPQPSSVCCALTPPPPSSSSNTLKTNNLCIPSEIRKHSPSFPFLFHSLGIHIVCQVVSHSVHVEEDHGLPQETARRWWWRQRRRNNENCGRCGLFGIY